MVIKNHRSMRVCVCVCDCHCKDVLASTSTLSWFVIFYELFCSASEIADSVVAGVVGIVGDPLQACETNLGGFKWNDAIEPETEEVLVGAWFSC